MPWPEAKKLRLRQGKPMATRVPPLRLHPVCELPRRGMGKVPRRVANRRLPGLDPRRWEGQHKAPVGITSVPVRHVPPPGGPPGPGPCRAQRGTEDVA